MRISDWSSDVCSSDLPAAHGLGDGAAHEDLLAGDATEVGGAVAHPVAVVVLVLEVPGAHDLAGLRTVEDLAARLGAEEAGVLVAHRFFAQHRDATDPLTATPAKTARASGGQEGVH